MGGTTAGASLWVYIAFMMTLFAVAAESFVYVPIRVFDHWSDERGT